MRAKISIERSPGGWTDSLRAYDVIVNEEKRTEIFPGESLVIEVESDRVQVYLRLASGRSRIFEVDVEPDSEVQSRCRPGNALTALYRITLGRNSYMHLELVERNA